MHMQTTPAGRHSYFTGPTDLIDSPRLIREQSPGGFTNPFLETSAQHAYHDISLLRTLHSNSNEPSHTDFPKSSSIDTASHFPLKSSLSTSRQLASSSIFSSFHAQDTFSPACRPSVATLSASSLPVASSQYTHCTTPDCLRALVASPFLSKSWGELWDDGSPFALDITPLQLFKEARLPPLFDPQCSPVVRRSLGDVTPTYDLQGHVINDHARSERASRDCFCKLAKDDTSTDNDRSTPSPSPRRKSGTPFLQRLCQRPVSPHNLAPPHTAGTSAHITPPLASPFSLKIVPAHESCIQPSSVTPPPAQSVLMPDSKVDNLKNCGWHTPRSEQCHSVSLFSSPLSELSTVPSSHSPLPFDLKDIFEEEDRKHRMKTRSAAKLSTKPNAPTARKRLLKRRSVDLEDRLISARTDDIASDTDTSPPRKKTKTLNKTASLPLRETCWIMSKGAGPGTFSAKASSKRVVLASNSTSPSNSTPPSPETYVNVSQPSPTETSWQRRLPPSVPINTSLFPNFYRKFPVPSFFHPEGADHSILIDPGKLPNGPKGHARVNISRGAYDLYTPRFTKGAGHNKQGLCPICFESVERGGAGRQEWFLMKFSAYKCYHMQYFHGISPTTGEPFSPPIGFRIHRRTQVRKLEKNEILEGKCHKCLKWTPVEGVKIGTVNVKELFWWKHAAICHKRSKISEDTDIFVEDEIFRRLKAYEASSSVIKDVSGQGAVNN